MTRHIWISVVSTLAVSVLLSLFVYNYVQQEHPAYLWDWGLYYDLYQDYGATFLSDPSQWATDLRRSISKQDYNASSIALLTPVYLVGGASRVAYIMGITGFFVIPAALTAVALSIRANDTQLRPISVITVATLCIMCPALWQSSLRGMPDIIGLIPLGIATIIIINSDYLEHNRVRNAVLIGLLVWLSFMLRRWYAYAGVALLLCTFSAILIRSILKGFSIREITSKLTPLLIVAAVGGTMLLIFQFSLTKRVITSSYSDLYQGYQAPFSESIWRILDRSGYLFFILVISGLVLSAFRRNYAMLFCGITSVVTLFLFTRTQAPSVQHGMPVIFFLLPAFTYPFLLILSRLCHSFSRLVFSVVTIILCGAIFAVSFIPSAYRALPLITKIAPQELYHPLKVDNFEEYLRLIAKLNELTKGGEKFSVIASSSVLSDSLLRALDNSLTPKIEWASHVDERDGFQLNILKVKYTVVATPTPLHLPITSQRVISIPAEQIISSTGIGKNYKKLSGPFHLGGGHDAYIYKKDRELTKEAIDELALTFKQHHPSWVWDGADWIGHQ